jgi:hypothetical protein
LTFPNLVFDSKSDNPISRYLKINIKLLFWSFFIIIKCFLPKTGDILNFSKFSIFPGNVDFAGVAPEKVGYFGIGLTDFESKTRFQIPNKFYISFQKTSI